MMRVLPWLVVLLFVPPPGEAAAQRVVPVQSMGAQQDGSVPALGTFTERMTLAWGRNDAAALGGMVASPGVSIATDGKLVGPLAARQASAVLRKLFDESETISVTLTSRKELPGSPVRAYLELIWQRRARGTTIPERVTVFVALTLQESAWRITDIRFVQ